MSRPLRVNVKDGWYHITARGIERRSIFLDDSYRKHFLNLLEEMSGRFVVGVNAYVLMDNHYHLLLQTPHANASDAMHWLNVSYSAWFNARRRRAGHLFQGRFKSTLIDGAGSWLLEASAYLHLNPVRTVRLGSGKRRNSAEARGLREPSKQGVSARLKALRTYRWSSYRAYAGHCKAQKWLSTETLLKRADGAAGYRRYVQEYVTRGEDPEVFTSLVESVAVGTEAFLERARTMARSVTREHTGHDFVRHLVPFKAVINVVEETKGEPWADFRDRHGDWGRNLALYLARQKCGLTNAELGTVLGGVNGNTVGQAVFQFRRKLESNRTLALVTARCLRKLDQTKYKT